MFFRTPLLIAILGMLWVTAPVSANTTLTVSNSAEFQDALDDVLDQGVIEMEAGTYYSPSGGFLICDPVPWEPYCDATRSFTIRPKGGADVILSGGNSDIILVYKNDYPSSVGNHTVAFEGVSFVDGYSDSDGKSGGITLNGVNSSFTRVHFGNNTSQANNTGGAALFAYQASNTVVTDCTFDQNSAKNEGGALASADGTLVITRSVFTNNHTSGPNHRPSATGGAVHVTSTYTGGDVLITDTHFEGNRAGCCAGALFSTGRWDSEGPSKVKVVNSSFVDNHVETHSTVECGYNAVGGALHGEDNTEYTIQNSRFIENTASTGGAVSLYRSIMNISQSLFVGNHSFGTVEQGFGGTLMGNSNDIHNESTEGGSINRRTASLTITDSFFQGRIDGEPSSWSTGGCIFLQGDGNRMYGRDGVTKMGSLADNRATLVIERTAFDNCDIENSESGGNADTGTGTGGALSTTLSNITFTDSIVINSDADGTIGSAGGARVTIQSDATFSDSTFANNTASARAGAIQVSGSQVLFSGIQFMRNEITGSGKTTGSAMWNVGPKAGGVFPAMPATGVIYQSVFSNNDAGGDLAIWDQDFTVGPPNALEYKGNSFWSPVSPLIYRDSADTDSTNDTVDDLNELVVVRDPGVEDTDKAPENDNQALSEAPDLLALLVVPSVVVEPASTDPNPGPLSYVVYAWDSEAPAELNGEVLSSYAEAMPAEAGTYTLVVGGKSQTVEVTQVPEPSAPLAGLAMLLVLGWLQSGRVRRMVDPGA